MSYWPVQPLKRLASVAVSNVDKKSDDVGLPVQLCNYTDVYYGDRIAPSPSLMRATATAEQVRRFRLQANDVVITKDSETANDIGIPAFVDSTAPDLVCGYHLAILRPRHSVAEGRFLYWAMSSTGVRRELEVGATGVTRYGLKTEVIERLGIPTPPAEEQRAIADYLDTETARIDALITKKRRMIELLDEWHQASLLETLGDWRVGRSKTLRQYGGSVLTGPFGTVLAASEYVEGGCAADQSHSYQGGSTFSRESHHGARRSGIEAGAPPTR